MELHRRRFADASEQEWGLHHWMQRYVQLKPGSYDGSVDTLDLPGVTIAREWINVAIEQRVVAPLGRMVFVQPLTTIDNGRINATRIPSGHIVMLHGGEEMHVSLPADSDMLIVTVDKERLPPDLRRPVPAHITPGFSAADVAGTWFLSLLVSGMAGELTAVPEQSQLLADLMTDKLAYLFERILSGGRALRLRSGTDFRLFQRARELVSAENEEPHTISELALRLGVSAAALRQAFMNTVGIGPGSWLRQQRLDGARRDLIASQGNGATVSEVAMKWGFWHLGRFSAYYAEQYGESPSQTARRVPADDDRSGRAKSRRPAACG